MMALMSVSEGMVVLARYLNIDNDYKRLVPSLVVRSTTPLNPLLYSLTVNLSPTKSAPVALLLGLMLQASPATAESNPSGTWLDGDLNWNQVGASLPQAPAQEGDNLATCQHTVRPAVLPEDKLVEAAGWTLTDAAQIYGATTLVTGMADADGMCRPFEYQVFVFTNGKFSGTLSPIPMNSRTDGSLFKLNLYREGSIDASFNRYGPGDPQCCASRESRLFYKVDTKTNPPLLVPQLPADTYRRPNP